MVVLISNNAFFLLLTETPPESGTEITIFTSLESQATIPINETVTFAVDITIAEPFMPDLQNKLSLAFRNMRSRFLSFLIPIFRFLLGFFGFKFNCFTGTPGSIVADFEILYNSTEPIPTVEEVESPIAQARDNGSAPFNISSLQVTKKGELQYRNITYIGRDIKPNFLIPINCHISQRRSTVVSVKASV
ncbi:Hypothetical predicted protein [Paramuricea clavata]|uniref:Uncharacterized protein n=1 Tax=Paramuricea clavata TaxID=317549 RepID=A0A7D9LDA8_PARCT|nr:Hypothetical predicted protein [Paramuricea clavata]